MRVAARAALPLGMVTPRQKLIRLLFHSPGHSAICGACGPGATGRWAEGPVVGLPQVATRGAFWRGGIYGRAARGSISVCSRAQSKWDSWVGASREGANLCVSFAESVSACHPAGRVTR